MTGLMLGGPGILRLSRRRFLAGLGGVAMASFRAGPGLAEAAPESVRLTGVGGTLGRMGADVMAVAFAKGFIEEELKGSGTRPVFQFLVNGTVINEAFANQQFDIAQNGGLPAVIGQAGGVRTRVILADVPLGSFYLVGRAALEIRTVEELKGHSVGVAKGLIPHFALLKLLDLAGLTEADIKIVDIKSAGDSLAAIAAGQLDAIVGTDTALPLVEQGVLAVIVNLPYTDPRACNYNPIVVSEAFERTHPEVVARVARGLIRAAHWAALEENREEVLRIWSAGGTSLELLHKEFVGRPLAREIHPTLDPYFVDGLRQTVATARKHRLIRAEFDVAQWVEPRYAIAAVRDLGLTGFWPDRPATN